MDDSLSTATPEGVGDLETSEEFPDPSERASAFETAEADEEVILRRAAAELAERKAELRALAVLGSNNNSAEASLQTIRESLADPSSTVRAAAVRALYRKGPEVAASLLNEIIREGSVVDRSQLANAIVDSGTISNGTSVDDPKGVYSQLALLLLLAKSGEVNALIGVIRNHPNLELRLALIKALACSSVPAVIPALQQLLIDPALPREIRTAVMEVILDN